MSVVRSSRLGAPEAIELPATMLRIPTAATVRNIVLRMVPPLVFGGPSARRLAAVNPRNVGGRLAERWRSKRRRLVASDSCSSARSGALARYQHSGGRNDSHP